MKEVRPTAQTPDAPASNARTAARQAAEDAVERERARIARELHDGIATDLAAAISLFKTHMEGHPKFGKDAGRAAAAADRP